MPTKTHATPTTTKRRSRLSKGPIAPRFTRYEKAFLSEWCGILSEWETTATRTPTAARKLSAVRSGAIKLGAGGATRADIARLAAIGCFFVFIGGRNTDGSFADLDPMFGLIPTNRALAMMQAERENLADYGERVAVMAEDSAREAKRERAEDDDVASTALVAVRARAATAAIRSLVVAIDERIAILRANAPRWATDNPPVGRQGGLHSEKRHRDVLAVSMHRFGIGLPAIVEALTPIDRTLGAMNGGDVRDRLRKAIERAKRRRT